jgi:hypothetical protein
MTKSLSVPLHCTFCGQVGTVKLEQTIRGEIVTAKTYCTACHVSAAVSPEEVKGPEVRG